MKPILSLLIPTIPERKKFFDPLYAEFKKQIYELGVEDLVEIIVNRRTKQEISIGAKRHIMILSACGEYVDQFDDDDWPEKYFIEEILKATEEKPDCIGFKIRMTTNGVKEQMCCHSLQFPEWENNVAGYDFVRNVTHFNPVLRKHAIQTGFKDLRWGEDREYSDRVTLLCKHEVFINKVMFHYRYTNKEAHNVKYGLK